MRNGAAAAALAVVLVASAGCRGRAASDDPMVIDPSRNRPVEQSVSYAPLPEARTEVAGASHLGGLVAVGGLRADGTATARVDVLMPLSDWSRAPDLPMPLHHAGAASWQFRVWVVGGYTESPDRQWKAVDTVFSWAVGETGWLSHVRLPSPRGALALVSAGDSLVAVGGSDGSGPRAETWVLPRGFHPWSRGPDLVQRREHLAGAFAGGRVYAVAGRTAGLDTNLASVESWADGESGWRPEPSLARSRSGAGAASVRDQVCVAGGEGPHGTERLVECLVEGGWRDRGQLTTPRHGLAVASEGRFLHTVGGGAEPGLSVSAAHERLLIARTSPPPDG